MATQRDRLHNLPQSPTTFIGRDREQAEIMALLEDPACRLLTLTGLGGIGKTRLALVLAERVQNRFPDGVHFIPLQPLQSPDQIIASIVTTLGIHVDQKPHEQLLAWLHDKHLLLVLDNFEHLLEGVDLLTDMLEAAPNVKLLVTSRDALRLRGEWLHRLHGLEYPDMDSVQTDTNYSAVDLFIERARQQGSNLNLEAQYPNIVHICQLVEGMPLGLELAASWVKSLTLAEIISELEQSLSLLETRAHDMPDRHGSMDIVFAHSWHLLSDEERAVLRGCSVFRGGCTRNAAEQVTGATLSVLTSLVEKSLLRHDPDTGRFDLHELLRQYTSGKLNEMPEVREKLLDRHCDYYTEYLHQQEKTIHLSDQTEVLRDLDNLRAAWRYAAQQCNLTALRRAAASLHWLYHFQGWHDEGAAMFYLAEEALYAAATTDEGRFLLGMMQLYRCFYDPERAKHPPVDIEAALSLWDGLDERSEMALALSRAMLGLIRRGSDPARIIAITQKSLALSRRYNDLPGVAIALMGLASVSSMARGQFAEAQRFSEEALAIDRQIGFDLNARWAESTLGGIAYLEGRFTEARTHFEASIAHHHSGGIVQGLSGKLNDAGNAALQLGEDATARAYFTESMATASDQQRYMEIAHGKAGLGIVAALQGDSATATAHYEDAQNDLRSAGLQIHDGGQLEGLIFLAHLLGQYEFVLAHYEAIQHRRTGYRIPLMRAQSRAGHALLGLEDYARAKTYLFAALREAADMGAWQILLEALTGIAQLPSMPPALRVELLTMVWAHPAVNRFSRVQAQQVLARLELQLPPDDYAVAVESGQSLSVDSALSLVKPFSFGLSELQLQANRQLVDPLSLRELEVLVRIAEGLTNREIADQLYIGISTVKKHINHIYSKLDVQNRADAIQQARALHLVV